MRSTLSRIGAAGVALLLSGCWWAPGQGPSRQAYNRYEDVITVEAVADLEQAWNTDLSDEPLGAPVVPPNGLVVVGTDHTVHGVDRLSGAPAWVNGPTGDLPHHDPQIVVVGDGRLALGLGTDAFLWATNFLDQDTGRQRPGIIYNGGKVEGVRDGRAAVYNPHDTGEAWNQTLRVVDITDGSLLMTDFIEDHEDEPGVTLGTLAVLHAGYGVLSDQPGGGYGTGVRAIPVTGANVACGPTGTNACPTWVTPVDGTRATAPVLSDDEATMFVATDAGTVYALDAGDGTVLWTASVGAPVADPPALDGTTLFVPTGGGALVALPAAGCGAATCAPLWSTDAGSPLTVQPAVAGGVVFTGAADGTVAGYDAAGCGTATCDPLWSATTGSEITGAPAVSGGHLYVGSADGQLTAFRQLD